MGVDCQSRQAEHYRGNHVGGLAPHAWERLQFVDVALHLAAEVGHELLRHAYKMTAFVVGIRDGVDVLKQLIGGGRSHGLGGWVGGKEGRSGHIDPFVGTLRRQDDRHQ